MIERRTVVAGEHQQSVVLNSDRMKSLTDFRDPPVHHFDHGVDQRYPVLESGFDILPGDIVRRLQRTVRRVPCDHQEERLRLVAGNKLDCLVGKHVGQVAAVRPLQRSVAVQVPPVVVGPTAPESSELVESPGIGVKSRVERPVVPLTNHPGCIARSLERIGNRSLAECYPVVPENFLGSYGPGTNRVAPSQQRGP